MRWLLIGSIVSIVCLASDDSAGAADPTRFKAGVASKVITPTEPMWMAGYSGRNKPAEDKVHDLFIKALALEDSAGNKLVLLTSDVLGLQRDLTKAVAVEVQRRTGLPRECLMFNSSHTHCGPALRDMMLGMYDMPPEMVKKVPAYTDRLKKGMIETIVAAIKTMKPARLAIGKGIAGFAVNRRERHKNGTIINGYNPKGPVDHDVPVLRVESTEGELRAVVFGYACHNTTMQFYKWCGDYAGFTQANIEKKHPGALALFWIGCGGDANPLPRSKIELCEKYGRELANAVEKVLAAQMTPLAGKFGACYGEVAIPFDKLPTREQLSADLLSKQLPVRKRAAALLKVLETTGKIDDHYRHYPVQAWSLGEQLLWIALGGETLIDYNLRIKKELGGKRPVWITGYANDVMAYIPSARVLKEGGYEADSSMIYYGMPTKWAPAIEDKIIGKVHEVVKVLQKKNGRENK
jgi:neutral ceramidase